ncbi:MAG TPA: ATP-grasp domain-containing protein [Candidatus Stackebrandtia excrementipullorum]|nr:ATP-grasp domain-containing protein [Candidatus Stackebrandtia excrementipullorum]
MKYVLAGFTSGILRVLERMLPERSVVLLEDPYIVERSEVSDKIGAFGCVERLVPTPLQDENRVESVVAAVESVGDIGAVIPGHEYGVLAAAALAERHRLPGAGMHAAKCLRDKASLRAAATTTGIAQPDWAVVDSLEDVLAFPRRPLVLKPSNRQASVGVELTEPGDDDAAVSAAWHRTRAADEPMMASPDGTPPRHLVEHRLSGREVSVEALVERGRTVFVNQTAKTILPGPHPVELAHVVPAPDPVALDGAMRQLVEALDFGTGVLHAEWILVDDEPHLIECAGRFPGDEIVPLIDLAYGGSLTKDLVTLLSGQSVERRAQARRGAAVRFLTAPPGRVQQVTGIGEARKVRGVLGVDVTAAPGDVIAPVSSSWDRVGRVMAIGRTASAAREAADTAAAQLTVTTGDDSSRDVS